MKKIFKRHYHDGIIKPVVFVVLVMIAFYTVFIPTRITGESMADSFHSGSTVMIVRCFYTPSSGDVVRVDIGSDILFKRIIGMPGDTVEAMDGVVYVNGIKMTEPYVKGTTDDFDKTKVPENSVFVMGDNREDSLDSRDFGAIKTDRLLGKYIFPLISSIKAA